MLRRLFLCCVCFVVGLLLAGLLLTPAQPVETPVYRPPTFTTPKPKPKPVAKKVYTKPTSAVTCLAQNLYYEANGEPADGLRAVAATVFNRASAPTRAWPNSICAVVYQYRQYSWTLQPQRWMMKPPAVFVAMAKEFIAERKDIQASFPDVTHYHRYDVSPKWAPTLNYATTIGQHVFYTRPVPVLVETIVSR